MEHAGSPGAGDDGLNRPHVTPAPAPSDDRLIGMAAASAIVGAIVALIALRWFRRNLVISRRDR